MFGKSVLSKFNRVIEIAKALRPLKTTGRAFHATMIFEKSKLVSIGVNNYNKTHPLINKYNYIDESDSGYRPRIHSELAAVLKLGKADCSRRTFFNVRIDNNENLGMSKPCEGCKHLLAQIGFKKYYYTDEKGKIKEFIGS